MTQYRPQTSTQSLNMAGARLLWRATHMKDEDRSKPIIAIDNSFAQVELGHVHIADVHHVSLINCNAPAEHTPQLSVNKLNTSDRVMVWFLNSQTGFGGHL